MYSGDYVEDATVILMFNTFTSDDPSASSTITNFLNTDVHIHKDDALTQRNNAAGITVSVDFDGITGSHMIKIDTSDDTVAGFWVTGKDYFVRIEGATIDGATINAMVGHFSIENRFTEVDVVKWLGQACHAVSENGVPKVDLDQIGGVVQSLTDFKDLVDTGYDPTNHKIQSDLIYIHGSALTETAGQLAAAFKKLFDVATPLLVASDVMRGTNSANTVVPDAAGVAATPAEVATALINIHLDHLLAVDYDPASKPGIATALLNELVENDGGVSRFTENALEQAPSGTGASAATIADAVWDEAIADHTTGTSFGAKNQKVVPSETINDYKATGFSTHDAAAVKTAIEAAGSHLALIKAQTDLVTSARMTELDVGTSGKMAYQLDKIMIALVNKMIVTEANGNTEQFSDADVSLGSITAAFSTDGTYTTRKKMVI